MRITITTTRYKEPNRLLHECLESLSKQKNVSAEVLMLDQFYNKDTLDLCGKLSNHNINFSYIKIDPISLCFARNYAIKKSPTDILLYIDADAIADEYRAYELSNTLSHPKVAIAGGKIMPKWHKSWWISKAPIVQDIYSLLDLGNNVCEINRVIGANFGINISRLQDNAYFDEKFSRRNGILISGDDSDLCKRSLIAGKTVLYNGRAIVVHQILPERLNYGWILKRFFWGGYSKALIGSSIAPNNKKINILNYIVMIFVLPAYFLGFLKGKFYE